MNVVWLAADQPDEGERQANEAMAGWSHEGFHRQHYSQALARIQTELYRGNAEAAWRLVARHLDGIRAHAALARAGTCGSKPRICGRAPRCSTPPADETSRASCRSPRKDARRIRRFGMRWSDAIATAARRWRVTLSGAPARRCPRHAGRGSRCIRACRHDVPRGGRAAPAWEVQGGERGRALVNEADAWMAAQGIRNPARMARLIAPGFPESRA